MRGVGVGHVLLLLRVWQGGGRDDDGGDDEQARMPGLPNRDRAALPSDSDGYLRYP